MRSTRCCASTPSRPGPPDGTKIAFSTTRDANNEIYTMNADGTGQVNRSNNAAYDTAPAPDGGSPNTQSVTVKLKRTR